MVRYNAVLFGRLARIISTVNRLPLPLVCLAILAVGFAVRFAIIRVIGLPPAIEWAEAEKIAKSLAETGSFANPYFVQTGPTAHHAPIYPYLLSLIYGTFGYGESAILAQVTMNLFFAAVTYALIPVLVHTAQLPSIIGIAAGFAGAVAPLRILKEVRWEASLTAAVLVVFSIGVAHWWSKRPHSVMSGALAGVLAGTAVLTSTAVLPVAILIALAGVYVTGRRVNACVGYLITLCAVLTPWTIRNHSVFGTFVPLRSNFGLEFSLSNHNEAFAQAADNVAIGFPDNYFHRNHPWSSRAQAERVRELGEPGFNRMRLRQALEWCRQNPGTFLRLTAVRTVSFWFPRYPMRQWYKILPAYMLTVLAFTGLYNAVKRRLPIGIFFACLWFGFPLVYYVVQMDTRYRFPLDWSEFLLATSAVYALLHSRLARLEENVSGFAVPQS